MTTHYQYSNKMDSPLQSVEKKLINKYQDQAAFEADPEQIVSGA